MQRPGQVGQQPTQRPGAERAPLDVMDLVEAEQRLADLLDGTRTTTDSPLTDYEQGGVPLPEVGTLGIVLDGIPESIVLGLTLLSALVSVLPLAVLVGLGVVLALTVSEGLGVLVGVLGGLAGLLVFFLLQVRLFYLAPAALMLEREYKLKP